MTVQLCGSRGHSAFLNIIPRRVYYISITLVLTGHVIQCRHGRHTATRKAGAVADSETATPFQHPRFARAFARFVPGMDRRGAAGHRRAIVSPLSGRVVEIGAGTGATFRFYPPAVNDVLALEPDDYLRAIATREARDAPVPVRVQRGHSEAIPVAGGSVDAVVVSLLLCSVPDQGRALAEISRVLRPGGILAFYEHVRSHNRILAAGEDLITPAFCRVAGGCHPNRDTVQAITEAGFVVDELQRFGFSVRRFVPPVAHVVGHAVKR